MRRKRSRRRKARRLIVLAVIVLLVFGLAVGACKLIPWPSVGKEDVPPDMLVSDKTTEIMVMGVDPRTDDTGRSDTLFLVSLDESAKRASVLSIPRDTRVEMEKGAYEKINHAYAYGGHEYTQAMLERLLATRLDGYVLVDIHAFERMIDALGGVDIDVEKSMHYEDPWDEDGGLVIDLEPGEQHLDGAGAMQYVRFRDEEGDIGRIRRQQKFLQALLARAASPEVIPHIPQLVREMASVVETDMEVGEMIRIASILPDVKGNGVASEVLPGMPAWWQETSYWLPDIPAARKLFAQQTGLNYTAEMDARAAKDAEEYSQGLPEGLADVNGTIRMTSVSDADKAEPQPEKKDAKPEKKSDGKLRKISPENIRVRVLNCSGIKGAAAASADVLRGRGFNIDDEDVGNGPTNDREETVLTVPKGTESLFDELPFPCVVRVGDSDAAVLEIGRDYKQ
ncbi:MAG: LCP family protein [Schwartzia sp.]|nr:LCP family protein [Schwartzia sp. (in: firmicutes)]